MTSTPDLRAYLRSLDAATLAELLSAQAERDPRLRHDLELRAGTLAEAHRLLDDAAPESAPPEEGATTVGPVLDTVARLLDAGTQADLAPLARRTVDKIWDLDHNSGELRRAVTLYARACVAHPPAHPERLADWILGTQFDRTGWPQIDLADFADALGDKGLQRIRSAVDKILAEESAGARQGTAQRLLEQLAEVSGDVDTLVAILSAKPPRLDIRLRIVRVLRAAGRHNEAIAYAAKALGHDKGKVEDVLPMSRDDSEDADEQVRAYRMHVEELIAHKDASCYREAAKELRKLRALHKSTDTAEEFSSYLADLLEIHKRKTRLLAEVRNARIAMPKVPR